MKTKKTSICALALLLVLVCTACGGGNRDLQHNEGAIDTAILDNYVYLAEFSHLSQITDRIHGTIMHDGRILIYYTQIEFPDGSADGEALEPPVSTIIIETLRFNGTSLSRTEIPNVGAFIDIAGLRVTEEGSFALIFADTQWAERGGNITLFYAEYTPQGVELARREISDIVPENAAHFELKQALFLEEGIALLTFADGTMTLSLLDNQLALQSRAAMPDLMFIYPTIPMVQTRNGRLIVADLMSCEDVLVRPVLREFDLQTGGWGGTFPISLTAGEHIRSLHLPHEDSPFDLYIADGSYLFGYHLETESKTVILSWVESRIAAHLNLHLNVLNHGPLSLLTGNMLGGRFDDWHTEFTVLTPTPREHLPDYEVITLGGLLINHMVLQQVMEFNRQNQTHQIRIVERFRSGDEIDFAETERRFLMDFAIGRAPDIVWGAPETLSILAESDFLLNLYTFIDADPDVSRSDFFPNLLNLLETGDGSLPILPYSFDISTLIGLSSVIGDIDTWTFAEMYTLVEQALDADMPYILKHLRGHGMDAERFLLVALMYSNLDFLNLAENTADLDNEDFVQLLEFAARLPRERPAQGHMILDDGGVRMIRGELLLTERVIDTIGRYQVLRYRFGDDLAFLGWPSRDGGGHAVRFEDGFAINAASTNQDAAWEFIRGFFTPCAVDLELFPGIPLYEMRFPLRIDLLDAMIIDAMTPRFELDENDIQVEIPRGTHLLLISCPDMRLDHFSLYAMTELEAREFRSIIENISIRGYGADSTIMDILIEELRPFLHGDRGAADTARIMQNRVQTYLWERG